MIEKTFLKNTLTLGVNRCRRDVNRVVRSRFEPDTVRALLPTYVLIRLDWH